LLLCHLKSASCTLPANEFGNFRRPVT
jgi:hypothetical protein